MCGICGVVAYGWNRGEDPAVLARMCETISHRGPDDSGTYFSRDGRVALGHRRLSIVDLSAAGHQPMSNEDGTVWIVFNGEIYNHAELRAELEAAGHQYRSHTDTETLIHLYEEHGADMLHRLRGMFAFAIWDSLRQELFFARDRVGIKPLYYAFTDGRLIFASEIKAILEHPSVERDVDETALYHYLTYYAAPAPDTLFKGIHKLPAGHSMLVNGSGHARIERWWDLAAVPEPDPALLADETVTAAHVRELLTDAVQDRLMADVPFGIMLSGGVDSTAIAALTRQLHSGTVRSYSVGYKDAPEHDETQHARAAAEAVGTDHHEVLIGQQDLIDYVPQLIHSQDEPLADWVCVPLHYVSKLVRESGTIVALVGEGSDEQFAGYAHYRRYMQLDRRAWSWYGHLPAAVRRAAHGAADPLLRRSGLPREIRELVRRAAADEPLFLSGAVAAWETDKQDMASAAMRAGEWGGLSSVPIAARAMEHLMTKRPDAGLLDRIMYQEFQLRLPELLLMRVDKISMASSIEARVPFLDHR
ncbi:MAG TPA: asparagine synthase (glutamine-hydrolyzing), partial [Longimicrobiales bacterium]|nr:asparagine synthase (glutamine-hydrolyzing) [Longimicrobiales bacterium]